MFFKNKCEECPVKVQFFGDFERYNEERRILREREVAQRAETIAWMSGEIDAINKRLRAAAENVGVLRWIQDDFVDFNKDPERAMGYIRQFDPEYRKTLFSMYAHVLEDVIRALDPGGKTKCIHRKEPEKQSTAEVVPSTTAGEGTQ